LCKELRILWIIYYDKINGKRNKRASGMAMTPRQKKTKLFTKPRNLLFLLSFIS